MNLSLHKINKKSDEISGSGIFFYGKRFSKKTIPIQSVCGSNKTIKGRSGLTTGLYIQK